MRKCILGRKGRVQESPQGFSGDCWPREQNQPRKKLSLTTDLQPELQGSKGCLVQMDVVVAEGAPDSGVHSAPPSCTSHFIKGSS